MDEFDPSNSNSNSESSDHYNYENENENEQREQREFEDRERIENGLESGTDMYMERLNDPIREERLAYNLKKIILENESRQLSDDELAQMLMEFRRKDKKSIKIVKQERERERERERGRERARERKRTFSNTHQSSIDEKFNLLEDRVNNIEITLKREREENDRNRVNKKRRY